MNQERPILYSFRRCPYAIRARIAIILSHQLVDLVEIDLKNKIEEFVLLSPKATVPVLKVNDNVLLEESLEIMQWAFSLNNPEGIDIATFSHELISLNDDDFKKHLDHYKYADRFPQYSVSHYQQLASKFPAQLNSILSGQAFLTSEKMSVVDIALFPFIRQFSFVDKKWFDVQKWPYLQRWLETWLQHDAFKQAFAWGDNSA